MTRSRRQRLVATGTLACAVATGGFAAKHVRAHVDELAFDIGATMLRHPATDQADPARTLLVNGIALHIASAGTAAPLPDVLDIFHARCRERGGRFGEAFERPRGMRVGLRRLVDVPLDGVLRLEDAERGYVACLDMGGAPLGVGEILHRARAVLAEGDLARIGDLRFVYAVRDGERTSYLALWTDGPLPVYRAFPAQGDAPGDDLEQVPRPPGTRRILSAHEHGGRARVAMYRAHGVGPTALAERYRAHLRAAEFVIPETAPGHDGFVAQRGDTWILVAVSDDGADALATVVPL